MTKNELITNIANRLDMPKTKCEEVINCFTDEITNMLVAGDKLLMSNFMSFETGTRAAFVGHNPKTGELEEYPESRTVKVKVSKRIKDLVNGKNYG